MLILSCDGIGTANLTHDDGRSILQHVVRPLAAKTGARPVRGHRHFRRHANRQECSTRNRP